MVYVADPHAIEVSEIATAGEDCDAIILLVGPEGGFSETEKDLFNRHGVKKIILKNCV